MDIVEIRKDKPLKGLKVLEMGSLIAGPFATRIMAEFGAEVIKIEPPGSGDPLRKWRKVHEGTSLWWYVQSRNKKSVTVNLKEEEGRELVKELVKNVDIVVENFKPGKMESWGLGYEDLKAINPGIIMTRVSGYGQTGPYKDRPGFGSIGEAMGGIRYLTGYQDRPPTRVGISLGDSIAALYAVIGTLMAVHHRDLNGTNEGQYIDVALYESVFSLMESMVPEYDVFNHIRERTGSTLPGIAPSNTYKCKDGKYIVIGGNGDAIFKRLMKAIGKQELGEAEKFSSNDRRAENADYLDNLIEEWTLRHTMDEALEILNEAQVPSGAIYNIKDMMNDPHFIDRGLFEEVEIKNLGKMQMPQVLPKMSETPGKTEWVGPELGENTEDVLKTLLAYPEDKIAQLKKDKIV
jgi:crotonobetainyl-CoA:carnitine CoA-transferase CaiB-like acyl-CoA transferase